MSLDAPFATVRDFRRIRVIAGVLVRHGFGDAAHRLGMVAGRVLHRRRGDRHDELTTPQRVCRAFEELGPTFIKFGQVLSTRVDIFPPEWIAEFEKLQDQVGRLEFSALRPELETALGAPVKTVFRELDPAPLAAGSIAQVHLARLADGTRVAVKIRRPGIQGVINADLRLLARLAAVAERELPELRRYRPRALVKQLAASLKRELDLGREGRAAERVASRQPRGSGLKIPRIHWEWTREGVNVQDYIEGIPGHDVDAARAAGLDPRRLARRGAEAMLHMILVDGFFHADPHAGNVFFLKGDRIALIDFGMVGRLSEERRRELADLLGALIQRDASAAVRVLGEWAGGSADEEGLSESVEEFIDSYHGVPLADLSMGAMLGDIAGILRDHQVTLPAELALLTKALVTLEGLGRRLDPGFDMTGTAAPILSRVLRDRYRPRALLRRGRRLAEELSALAGALPRFVKRLLATTRRGGLRIVFDLPRLDTFGRRVDRAASRITVGLVTAALIVGTAIIMTVKGGPTLLGLPLFGLLGFAFSSLAGVWLLASIWHGGHARH